MKQQTVEVLVGGKPVKTYAHNGKLFVEAKEGSEYTIKVKNDDWSRVLAVASVDGINVIDGSEAEDKGTGYIVNGRSGYEIKGFRTSNEVVNAFAFGKKEESYAAKSEVTKGDTKNVGVMAIKFYNEKTKPDPKVIYRDRIVERPVKNPWRNPWPSPTPFNYPIWQEPIYPIMVGDQPSYGPMMRSMSAQSLNSVTTDYCSVVEPQKEPFSLGTVFTEKELTDKVQEIEFEIGKEICFVEIYYASRAGLQAMGVPLTKETSIAFPQSFKSEKFCQPPKRS